MADALVLPLPPSGNLAEAGHPIETQKRKDRYRGQVWFAAGKQAIPRHVEDLPEKVRVRAVFYVEALRDDDNLHWGFKWVLDALKQKQRGKMRWRQGVADQKGYLIDDDPAHCEVAKPEQQVDRANPRLEITLEAVPQ